MATESLYKVDLLEPDQAKEILSILSRGGLCILPSDSSYVLTGDIRIAGVSSDINKLLKRDRLEISLAFGSIEQISSKMVLSSMGINFVRKLSPQGLTFVAMPATRAFIHFARNRLFTNDGTVGVRLTRSAIETNLASVFPLPTTPIRDDDGSEAGTADIALQIVRKRITKYGVNRPLAIIDNGAVQFCGRLSTVVKEEQHKGLWRLLVIREGAIGIKEIQSVASLCGYSEVISKDLKRKIR